MRFWRVIGARATLRFPMTHEAVCAHACMYRYTDSKQTTCVPTAQQKNYLNTHVLCMPGWAGRHVCMLMPRVHVHVHVSMLLSLYV